VSSALDAVGAGAWIASGLAGCCFAYSGIDTVAQPGSSRVAASTPIVLRDLGLMEILGIFEILNLYAVQRLVPDRQDRMP
jgi:hypothetical protein